MKTRDDRIPAAGLRTLLGTARGFVLFAFLLAADPVLAHRVTVFAWVEGGTVHTESAFSGGRKAVGAEIEVLDAEGNRLLTGKTDEEGRFSFPVPKVADLTVTLGAGMGHGATWTVTEEEIRAAGGAPVSPSGTPASPPVPPARSEETAVSSSGAVPSLEAIRRVVEKAVEEKMGPVNVRLARMEQRGPGVTEIVGGIGYILGLAGIAAWVSARRRAPGGKGPHRP
jgi:nickel transport protein